jgi:hypothetical protein
MKKLSLFLLAMAGMMIWSSQAKACDVEVNGYFEVAGPAAAQTAIHEDVEPFKGWAKVYLFNDTDTEYFTGIHFNTFCVTGGSAINHVFFIDTDTLVTPNVPYPPSSSQGIDGYAITLPTSTSGAEMVVNFVTPLAPGESGWVKVYTDNRMDKGKFGVSYYPLSVPEPATLALLGMGITFFASRRRK